jgi:hypothetical protein
MGAQQEYMADMLALFGSINMSAAWISRLHGELPRTALTTDLTVGASSDQSQVVRYFQATKTTGTAPVCPTYPPCPDQAQSVTGATVGVGGSGTTASSSGVGGSGGAGAKPSQPSQEFTSGCSIEGSGELAGTGLGFSVLLAISTIARRRKKNA